jgi:Ca2+-binding RTX toxin-like protein
MSKISYSQSLLDVNLSASPSFNDAFSAIKQLATDLANIKSLTTNFDATIGFQDKPVITESIGYIDNEWMKSIYPSVYYWSNYLDKTYTDYTHRYNNPHYVGLLGTYALTGSYVAKFVKYGYLGSPSLTGTPTSNYTDIEVITSSGNITMNGYLINDMDRYISEFEIKDIAFIGNDGSKWSVGGSIVDDAHVKPNHFNSFISITDTNRNSISFEGNKWNSKAKAYTGFTSATLTSSENNKFTIDGLKVTQNDILNLNPASITDFLNWVLKGDDAISVSPSDPAKLGVIHGFSGNDKITGSKWNDSISGDQGNDTMIGGYGDDTYYVDSIKDKVIEAAKPVFGNDTIISTVSLILANNVENLTLSGTSNLNATGNSLSNVIIGNAGNNTINGGLGNDSLTGGDGNDIFLLNSKFGTKNIDSITDFIVGTDKIALDDAIFKKLKGETDLSDNITNSTTAMDINDYIIYDTKSGSISYDVDGSGTNSKAVLIAIIGTGLTLSADDFLVV